MEKNTTKYFLGTAVLLVWGLLVYRIYNKVRPNNNWGPVPQEMKFETHSNVADDFALFLNYSNPFKVGKVRPVKVLTASVSSSSSPRGRIVTPLKKEKKKTLPKPVYFPKISYKGTINTKEGRRVALVRIDGQMMNLNQGEKYEKVLLSNIYEDSIQMKMVQRDTTVLKAK